MFWRRGLDYNAEAQKLLWQADVFPKIMFADLDQRFPGLRTIVAHPEDLDKFDVAVTVASVMCSIVSFPSMNQRDADRAYEAIGKQLFEWNKSAAWEAMNVSNYITKYKQVNNATLEEALGMWVVLQTRGSIAKVSPEVKETAIALGTLILAGFSRWWLEK